MAKRHTLVATPPSKHLRISKPTNWDLCALCQVDTGTALQCPANNNMSAPTVDGYVSLTSNLIEFAELGEIPMNIDIARLNDGDGIETTMRRHTARWHKACRLKVNQTKLKRLQHSMK